MTNALARTRHLRRTTTGGSLASACAELRPPALCKLIARVEQALDDLREPGKVTYVRQGRFAGTFVYRPAEGSRTRRVAVLARDIAREAGLGRVDALDDREAGIVRLRVQLEPDPPRIPIALRLSSDADILGRRRLYPQRPKR